ncbi:hypothetical protein [Okeania sp. SIO3B5]|nr:hypothetical protein [Okeania sp. SIO3B5]
MLQPISVNALRFNQQALNIRFDRKTLSIQPELIKSYIMSG